MKQAPITILRKAIVLCTMPYLHLRCRTAEYILMKIGDSWNSRRLPLVTIYAEKTQHKPNGKQNLIETTRTIRQYHTLP